jgi:hypothetical protein
MNLKALIAVLLIPATTYAGGDDVVKRPEIPVPQLTLKYAPEPLIPVPDGDDKIEFVRQGDEVPFSGQLFDPATALRWAHYLQQAKLRLKEDVVYERRVCNAHLDYLGSRLELEVAYSEAVEKDLRARVLDLEQRNSDMQEELRSPPWHKSRAFGIAIGVVGTSLVAGLSAWAVIESR